MVSNIEVVLRVYGVQLLFPKKENKSIFLRSVQVFNLIMFHMFLELR